MVALLTLPTAVAQLYLFPQNAHLHALLPPLVSLKAIFGEERFRFGRGEKRDLQSIVGQRLEKEQPNQQITKASAPFFRQNRHVPHAERTVLPPKPGGADCAIFPENDYLLGLIVQRVPTAAQNRPPDAQRQLDVAAHRVPSALYHLKNPLHHLERKRITMEHEKILRINELAKIKKERSLTADEEEERKALHQEYIAGFRQNMEAVLQNVRVKQPDGSLTPLKKKADKLH